MTFIGWGQTGKLRDGAENVENVKFEESFRLY